jgi:hypothetical protein
LVLGGRAWVLAADYDAVVAENQRLKRVIDTAADLWINLTAETPVAWEGGLDDAMAAAVAEIRDLRAENLRLRDLLREPIPEEPEANPVPPVDSVEEAWAEARLALDVNPNALGTLRAAVEATQAPLREQVQALSDRVLELEDAEKKRPEVSLWHATQLVARVEALESNEAHHVQSVWAQAEVVARLEEQIIDLRNRGATRAVRTVRTAAEKDAAGGEEGPSVEEVVAWWRQSPTPSMRRPPDE